VVPELPTLPEHLSSPPIFSGVRLSRFLIVCVCFVDRCLYFFPFCFGHCVVCSSLIYGCLIKFWCLTSTIPEYMEILIINNKIKIPALLNLSWLIFTWV
jgi:hypothetical protein